MNHFFINRFLKKTTVYEKMKYFFVLIITPTIHVKKWKFVHFIANIGRKVMSRKVCHAF